MGKNLELEAFWRRHVGAWRSCGETQRVYCDRHGLKRHSLSYWHLRLARGEVPARGGTPLTLIAASVLPEAAAMPCLSLASLSGWRLDFATLPPAGWVAGLCGGGA